MGEFLLVTIQVDMHDQLALNLQDDLTTKIEKTGAKGVLIDISFLEVVDSFMARALANISAMARILDAGCGEGFVTAMLRSRLPNLELTGFDVDLDIGNSCSVLPAVVLLFHEDVHPVHVIHGTVFFDVVGERLSQADQGNPAFVKNLVAHCIRLKHLLVTAFRQTENLKHKVKPINESHQQSRKEENGNNQ